MTRLIACLAMCVIPTLVRGQMIQWDFTGTGGLPNGWDASCVIGGTGWRLSNDTLKPVQGDVEFECQADTHEFTVPDDGQGSSVDVNIGVLANMSISGLADQISVRLQQILGPDSFIDLTPFIYDSLVTPSVANRVSADFTLIPQSKYRVRFRAFDQDGNISLGGNTFDDLTIDNGITGPADANLDGRVSFADFLDLQIAFGSPGGWENGDFNRDGNVSFADFLELQINFGNEYIPPGSIDPVLASPVIRTIGDAPMAVAIPEPGAFILLFCGLMVFVLRPCICFAPEQIGWAEAASEANARDV